MNCSYLESCESGYCKALKSGLRTRQSTQAPIFMPKASISNPSTPSATADLAASAALPATYEAAMGELEGLVSRLESGEMPLEQLLTGYQRGSALLQFCRERLQAVEDQIKVLDDGTLKPWKPQ